MNIADLFIIIVSFLLIIFVLLQQSEDSVQDAFSGSSSELFKNKKVRGFDLFMLRGTTILSVALVVLVLLSNYLHSITL